MCHTETLRRVRSRRTTIIWICATQQSKRVKHQFFSYFDFWLQDHAMDLVCLAPKPFIDYWNWSKAKACARYWPLLNDPSNLRTICCNGHITYLPLL
jgi:hypothetical protein